MQKLANNCRIGKMTVYPSNWKTARAEIKRTWYIKYRFYDDNLKKEKQVMVKGMNREQSLKERQRITQALLQAELHKLIHEGYNPITERFAIAGENDISEHTPFVQALEYAFKRVKISHSSTLILRSCLKYITLAAEQKHYDKLPVNEIKRRHIVLIFEQIEKIKGTNWTAHSFNSYRAYLGILYKELVKLDIVPANMGYAIEKHIVAEKVRETLTTEERKKINDHLYNNYYTFWRLVHIFFHAGCRETELMQVRKEDVDLQMQRFRVTVKKGKKGTRQEWRTIKDIALPLWIEIVNEAESKQYLFSKGLKPGVQPVRSDKLTLRWRVHVKEKLGVSATMYSLKHSNLEEIAQLKGIKSAQYAAGHSTEKMTKVYAFGEDLREQAREHEIIKSLENKFA